MSVYLLHFERPLHGKAQHYLGTTGNLADRLRRHKSGRGARLTRAARDAGIGMVLADVWPGDKHDERCAKLQHHHSRLCPICQGDWSWDEAHEMESILLKTQEAA